jgi:hypothetical protein
MRILMSYTRESHAVHYPMLWSSRIINTKVAEHQYESILGA